ncbi:hypothetical protein Tco_1118677, partial [Tanacetum coccineum]
MLLFATILVSLNNVIYAIRVRELCSWTPTFLRGNSNNDEDGSIGSFYQEEEELPGGNDVESIVGIIDDIGEVKVNLEQVLQSKDNDSPNDVGDDRNNDFNDKEPECAYEGLDDFNKDSTTRDLDGDNSDKVNPNKDIGDEHPDSDPFGLDPLIKQRCGKVNEEKRSVTLDFPLGFTSISSSNLTGSSGNKLGDDASKQHSGFSVLERLEETITVGTALGLNMEGCENTLASLIADNGELLVWGNSQFDFASISARGMSCEIICVWNSLVFRKSKILCNDNYVLVEGLWIPNDVRLMWIVIYAPQNLSTKIALWSSLVNIIGAWDGNLVMMGNFNEVREAGGFKFTWTDKWGIPDHRPILLKDFKVDFGPTPFRFFHSWLELDVCNDLVVQTWTHDGIVEASGFISFKKKLKNLKRVIRDWVISKKANSNKLKREHQSRLVSINAKVDQGKRFQRFNGIQLTLNVDMPNMLSPTQRDSLDIQFSHDEIKRAVWDCGGDRAPGPDGFTFKFIMSFWDLIKDDVARFVNEFFFTSLIPKGCTSSFIALIPKVSNARNILDGPLILNEVMAWYHKRKKELMVFKVDFEKAFDSL